MEYRKLLLLGAALLNYCAVQAKVYEIIDEKTGKKESIIAENSLDIVITLHGKKGSTSGKETIAGDFIVAILDKEAAVGTATIIVTTCKLAQKKNLRAEKAIQNLLTGQWLLYRTEDWKFTVFINKETYADAITPDGNIDLEKTGLNKDLKPIVLKSSSIKEYIDELKSLFQKKEGPIDVASLNTVWSSTKKGKKVGKKVFVIGHGMTTAIKEQRLPDWRKISIAGLKGPDFVTFVQGLLGAVTIDGIPQPTPASMLFVESCYAASLNQLIFDLFDVPFAVSTDNYPGTSTRKIAIEQTFKKLFTNAYLFTSQDVDPVGGWKNWLNRRPWFDKKPFRKIFADFLFDPVAVRLPGMKFFRFIPVNERSQAITIPELLGHEIRYGKSAPIIFKDKKELLLYAGVIMLPFKLNIWPYSPPNFLSMIPGPSHHYIVKIIQKTAEIKGKLSPEDKGSVTTLLLNFGSEEQFYKKLFFIGQLEYQNHREIEKTDDIFPFFLAAGKTLRLTNVAIRRPSEKERRFGKNVEIICQHETTYYHTTKKPFKFVKITPEEAEKTISRWTLETTPLPIALSKATIVETENKFRNILKRNLKSVDLEQQIAKQEQYKKTVTQKTAGFIQACNSNIQILNTLYNILGTLKENYLEELKNNIESENIIEKLTQKRKELETATITMQKEIQEDPRIDETEIKFIDTAAKLSTTVTNNLLQFLAKIKNIKNLEDLKNEAKHSLKRVRNKVVSEWKKLEKNLKGTRELSLAVESLIIRGQSTLWKMRGLLRKSIEGLSDLVKFIDSCKKAKTILETISTTANLNEGGYENLRAQLKKQKFSDQLESVHQNMSIAKQGLQKSLAKEAGPKISSLVEESTNLSLIALETLTNILAPPLPETKQNMRAAINSSEDKLLKIISKWKKMKKHNMPKKLQRTISDFLSAARQSLIEIEVS